MSKRIYLVSPLLIVSCLWLMGCSSTTSDTTSTSSSTSLSTSTSTTTTTSTTFTGNVVISGRLSAGSLAGFSVTSRSLGTPAKVVAIENLSNKTYFATCDAQGNFSLNLPSGVSFEINLVDNNSLYFGPVMMSGGAASSEVIMGMKPNADFNFGEILFDATKGLAKPTEEPTTIFNPTDTANASSGVPLGAGTCGKDILASSTREGSDIDKDGIPNIFDADEDGDQIRNGILKTPSSALVVSSTVESVLISSNIWAAHGTTDEAKNLIAMRLHVNPLAGRIDEIASVEVTAPATIRDVATVRWAASLGNPVNYPAENSLWKDSGQQLYKTTTLTPNEWIISLAPKANMNVGDIFTIRVYYTNGSYQDFYITTAYVLTDWSKILTYNNLPMPANRGTNTSAEVFTTSSLEVVFSKPKDEDGQTIDGLSYSIIISTVEAASGQPLPVPPVNNNVEYRASAHPASFTIGASTVTVNAHELVTFEVGSYYYITPVAESADGQRNGEELWFRRQ